MDLTIVGPNLIDQSKGTFHVHKAHCADLNKRIYAANRRYEMHNETHDTVRSLVESYYGPSAGSFYEEAGYDDPETAWEHYVGEFWLAPCCAKLPTE